MAGRHFALVTGLFISLCVWLVGSAGLAQEPVEAPAETAAVAAPTPAPITEEVAPEQEAPAHEHALIGMGFFPFLWLAIVAVVVSLLMYFLLQVRLMGGPATNIYGGVDRRMAGKSYLGALVSGLECARGLFHSCGPGLCRTGLRVLFWAACRDAGAGETVTRNVSRRMRHPA